MIAKLAELREQGFCVLPAQCPTPLIDACREAFWPLLLDHLLTHPPNRGADRYFLPMPFEPPCFAPEFFFDPDVLSIVHGAMDDRAVADQWGCDVPLPGSEYQEPHIDYRRPLFPEAPDLALPPYILVVSFGLLDIGPEDGPIEIAPRGHPMQAVTLGKGDVLIRHPWALHRGSPNRSHTPRALVSIRHVRRWYADNSREVNAIPRRVWDSLTPAQQEMMRFPVALR